MLKAYQEIAIMVHRPLDKRQVDYSLTHWSKINQYLLVFIVFSVTLKYEKDPGGASNLPFQDIVLPSSFGTLYSNQGGHQSKGAQHYSGDHQRSRCLDVT